MILSFAVRILAPSSEALPRLPWIQQIPTVTLVHGRQLTVSQLNRAIELCVNASEEQSCSESIICASENDHFKVNTLRPEEDG